LEAVRPHQVEALIDIAEKEGQSLCEVVQRALARRLANLSEDDRFWATQEFRKLGIDLENL